MFRRVWKMDRKYYLKGIACAKINGHESQPNDAGGVHGKTNEFGLVEIFRDLKKITMEFFKIHVFWEGHKNWQTLLRQFDSM